MVHSRKTKVSDSFISKGLAEDLSKKREQEIYLITQYGTPNKDVRLKPPAIQKVTSVTNLSCTSLRVPAPSKDVSCKRSLSLQELSPSFQKHLNRRRAHLCRNGGTKLTIMTDNADFLDERTKIHALKTLCRFLRNAWRKNKEELDVKDVYLKSATSQVCNLKLQVSALKSLLKSDEQVISNSFKEIHSLKGLLATLQDKYTSVKTEKEGMQNLLDSTKEELNQVRSESYNDKNSLILAKNEASALEIQLQREREKIAKLKNDNRTLLDKVDQLTVSLKVKTNKMKNLDEAVDQLQVQANSHIILLRTAEEKIAQDERALEDASSCIRGLKKELGEAVQREGKLRAKADEATAKMEEQSRRFNLLLKEQTMKIVALETELAMSAPRPLKARFFSFASAVINVPLVVLETIASG